MNDPINEIFNGTPNGIDDDELQQMQAAEQQRLAVIQQQNLDQEEETQPAAGTPTATPSAKPKQEAKPEGEPQGLGKTADGDIDLEVLRKQGGEFDAMGLRGIQDFAIDSINFFTGGKAGLQKAPKFDNEVAQAGREISSVAIPLALSGGISGALRGAGASKAKILADPGFQRLATFGFNTGSGVLIDTISSTSEGDNLSGTLKQSFPDQFGWIPDDIATMDADSPDLKHKKNILEGFGLGLFTDLVGPVARLAKNKVGVYLPDKPSKVFPKPKKVGSMMDEVANSVTRRTEALDELGDFSISKSPTKPEPMSGEEYYIQTNVAQAQNMSPEEAAVVYKQAWDEMNPTLKQQYDAMAAQRTVPDLQEPMLGVHDMYGYAESGIRSVDDMGVISARVDNARIFNNIDSVNGRIGSVISDPAIKFAIEGSAQYSDLTRMLGDQITAAGRYGYETSGGKLVSSTTIDSASDKLNKSMGLMTRKEAQEFAENLPKRELKGQIKQAFKELIDYDQMQADALLQTSIAGQVSDMAQGLRLYGDSGSMDRGLDQILDRMEFLMIADYDTASKANIFKRMKNAFLNAEGMEDAVARRAEDLKRAQRSAKETVDNLRQIKAERPDMLEPLMHVYEASNGNVRTVNALNNYFKQSTGTLSKAFIDKSPDVPSVILKGFWGTVYNNALMAVGTPLRALASTAGILIERPITTLAGAMMAGDGYTLRRGMFVAQDTIQRLRNSFDFMGETFRRSADADYKGVPGRESFFQQDDKQMLALHSFADAKAADGDFGPQALMQQVEALNDIARSPLLRMGNRAMMALDGFTQAFIAGGEASSRAFDKLAVGKITPDMLEQVKKAEYDAMFKPDDMGRPVLTDTAVKAASGEVNMNLDNTLTDGLSELIKRVPLLKTHMLFTRTPINVLNYGATHLPFTKFISEFNDFAPKFNEVPLERLEKMLASRGIPFDDNAEIAYNQIRAELKGRKAVGTLAVTGAAGLFMMDGITGDGIDNPQVMKTRRELGWKPRSFKTPDGRYVSYDGIPGISDLLALTATVLDNMESLGGSRQSELLNALAFVAGTAVTEKSGMTNMEPLFKILKGDGASLDRWAAAFIPSAVTPGANGLLELQKLWSPQLKVVEDRLDMMLANRSLAKSALPDQYDWIDGGKVGEGENWFARAFNVYSPFKITGKSSPLKEFLIDIEYDNRPSMETDGRGIKLSAQEQSEIYRIISQDGYFKKELTRIMNSKEGQRFRSTVKAAQEAGAEVDVGKFEMLHTQIDRALNLAKEMAIAEYDLHNNNAIGMRRFDQNTRNYYTRGGDVDAILSMPK